MTNTNNILPFKDKKPILGNGVFIDPCARVMGDVVLGDNVVVMFAAIIRADDDSVRIGNNTVILEHSLVEAPKGYPVTIGENVLISHGAIVHGAKVGSGALIGIGARVLDGAIIGENSIIAAGALVPPGKEIPPNSIVMGIPGKVVREVTEEDLKRVKEELEAVHRKAKVYKEIFGGDR